MGLLNVNPFFSLHLNKDEHGEKVLHPSINLHITPSEHLFTKLIDKKHHVKKVILHSKLQQLQQQGPPILPGPIHSHPPIIHSQPPIIYSHPPNIYPGIPEDIHYPQYGNPEFGNPHFGNPHITPYDAQGFIPGGDHIPYANPGPDPLYFNDHPNSGFNPLYDAPPQFGGGSHYRNANQTNFNNARVGKTLKNDQNVVFPGNRKRRDVPDSLDSQQTLSRSRVSLLLLKKV